jgi:integrase
LASIEKRVRLNKSTGKSTVHYYVRYYEGRGKDRRRKSLPGGFTRHHDAEVAMGRMLAEQAAGTFGQPSQDQLFSEEAEKWLEEKEPEVGVRTFIDYMQVVKNHLLPVFGDRQINQIKRDEIVEFRNKKDNEFSSRTTNKILRVLKMVFSYAEAAEHLGINPSHSVNSVTQTKDEMDFLGRLEPDEIDRFLEASPPDYHALFFTAIWTGAREGELFALKWGNVDFEGRRIQIRQTYDKYGYREPKSPTGKRSIVLSPELAEVLVKHKATLKANGKGTGTDDPVFQNRNGKPLIPSTVIRKLHATLERADIRKLRFHDLRHTYGALALSMGAPPKFVQNQMGHASLTITLDTYGHWMPSAYGEFGEIFDDFVHNLVSKDEEQPAPAPD